MYSDIKTTKERLSRKSGKFNSALDFALHHTAKKSMGDALKKKIKK